MADGEMPSNLLSAPVAADIGLNATPKTGRNGFGIAAVAGSLGRFAASLFGPVTLGTTTTLDLTPNSAGVSPKQAGYLGGAIATSTGWSLLHFVLESATR
jgi:hypothetical protein